MWLALIAVSTGLSAGLSSVGLPAALLLGPMLAGIIFGAWGADLTVPRIPYLGAQALIGALVAASITPTILTTVGQHYLLFCTVMLLTLGAAAGIGWVISRLRVLPGPTAVYGTAPGAASAMVVLGEAGGADARLVAFMQYSRVLLVALSAALVARLWVHDVGAHTRHLHWTTPVHWKSVVAVIACALLGQQLARLLRLQAWPLLGPLLLLAVLHGSGWIEIELPGWLLAAAYAALGWHIGLGFRRRDLAHAGRSAWVVLIASLGIMACCAFLGWCLQRLTGTDPLTAYLATSPGGLDSVAIIAASSPHVDLPFVMALQAVRLLFVICLAPFIVRLVVRYSPHLNVRQEH